MDLTEKILSLFEGKTLREIGKIVGVAPSTISGWKIGSSKPTLKHVKRALEYTGESADWLPTALIT